MPTVNHVPGKWWRCWRPDPPLNELERLIGAHFLLPCGNIPGPQVQCNRQSTAAGLRGDDADVWRVRRKSRSCHKPRFALIPIKLISIKFPSFRNVFTTKWPISAPDTVVLTSSHFGASESFVLVAWISQSLPWRVEDGVAVPVDDCIHSSIYRQSGEAAICENSFS